MQVSILLDQAHGHFTNLDIITGRVILRSPNATNVSHILVKLEGESRTRLLAQPRPGTKDRPRPELEVHKLLYRVEQVFPPMEALADPNNTSFFVGPGQFEYPFSFKVPFNNICHNKNNQSTNINFGGFGVELSRPPANHVKATLPPSVYFAGEAEIRYYIKATVNRPSLLKENPRAIIPFSFVPIEPPRPNSDGEVYARRQHQFLGSNAFPLVARKTTGSLPDIFKSKPTSSISLTSPTSPTSPNSPTTQRPARFTIDARLPNPAILTCGQDVPLRILIKQQSERDEPLFLQTLQIELVGSTKVRAQGVYRTESTSWVITSLSNLHHVIGSVSDVSGTETDLTKEFWFGHPLPDSVAPSFITCNISRYYELVISLGLSYGSTAAGKDQFIVLPLRLNVEVFSGIQPPPALLKRMADAPPRPRPTQPVSSGSHSEPVFTSPSSSNPPNPSPEQSMVGSHAQPPPGYDEPPPSYEDAIAQDLPPLNGPRPGYRPSPAPASDTRLFGDQKS